MRIIKSGGPPGGDGTTTRIGFDGKFASGFSVLGVCATAPSVVQANKAKMSLRATKWICMISLFFIQYGTNQV
jgi:hypothetical protein